MSTWSLSQRMVAGVVGRLAQPLLGPSMRHARNECRWHLRGPLDAIVRSKQQFILASWHQDGLSVLHYMALYTHLRHDRNPVMLSSRSFEGELIARLVSPFGFDFVRGSHGKKGARSALRGQMRALRDGRDLVVVADGPGPPQHTLRPGPVYLSRRSGVPLYFIRALARPAHFLTRTWFNMVLPAPRCDIAVFSAGPIDVSGSLEEAGKRAEAEFHRLGEEVDAHLYLRPQVTGGVRWPERPV